MSARRRSRRWTWQLWLLGGLLVLATAHVQCDCDTAANCVDDVDCQAQEWTETCDGHWECIEGGCTPVCDEDCAQAQDCDAFTWPTDADCTQVEGHWECQADTCVAVCDPTDDCVIASDCEGLPWSSEDCVEAAGHWDCETGVCLASCNSECTTTVATCLVRAWPEACAGHWACELGLCRAVCDSVGCGNLECAPDDGETETSCPADCVVGCQAVGDCLGRTWEAPCQGSWTCPAQACEPRCDYSTCGDDLCDAADGEDAGSCPDDCLTQCQAPSDCIFEAWNQFCRGHWNCFMGECQPICEDVRCGDGVCTLAQGESQNGCDRDCLDGPCDQAAGCTAYPWTEACVGHWTCSAGGACEQACDATTCPDGACDVLGGETPDSCADDCAGYACQISGDCAALTLPAGCVGQFLCVERVCRPICS